MAKEFDKEAYKAQKKAEMDELFQNLNDGTLTITGNTAEYRKYLNTQARLDRYSVSNAILVCQQIEDARQLKTFDEWKKHDVSIKKGEKGISILEPYEYDTRNGGKGRGYKVRKVFDVSQTTAEARESRFLSGISERGLLKALIDDSPVPVEAVDMIDETHNALYEPRNRKLFVKRGLEPKEFFKEVSLEMAYAEFDAGDYSFEKEKYTEKAQAAAYMLCRKYGFETEGLNVKIPEAYQTMPAKDIRKDLTECKKVFANINERMNIAIEKQREAKENRER